MGLRDKFSRNKESEMDKWNDAGTADWLSDAPPPPAFKLKLKPKPQSVARQPKASHTDAAHRARQAQLRLHQERLRQAGLHHPPAVAQAAKKAPETPAVTKISIDLNLPKVHVPKIVIPWHLVRRWGIRAAIVLVILAGLLVALRLYLTSGAPETAKDKGKDTTAAEAKPPYHPLAPKDKPNLAAGDKSVSAYDPKRKLYSYNDNFEGNQLTVSQQPLPKSFSSDPIQIRKAADSINADDEVDTALGMVYIGFDEQANIQRMMLVYRDLLVFILSNKKMDKEAVKNYVELLR